MVDQQQQRLEALGPAERVISTLTTFSQHCVHNRTGLVTKDPSSTIGVNWEPVIWKEEDKKKVVYKTVKTGKTYQQVKVGTMNGDYIVKDGRKVVGEFRDAGLYPESVAFLYKQVAEVYKMDNEFAAHWASWAFPKEHRDLKVVLAAFMLVQNRRGDPVVEDGKTLFHDEDFRDVGEAMCLIRQKDDISPKLLLRIGDILALPAVAAINRELGFGNSARNPAIGRYYKVVEKWLRFREENLPMLEGLIKAGFRTAVMKLAQRVGYKPSTPKFFEVLRWKQSQAKDGRRSIAIGAKVKKAETWEGLSEEEICQVIVNTKPNWKRIVGLLPKTVGMTQAVVAAAVEAGCMSEQDLIILTPTLEELGLLKVKEVEKKWKAAIAHAENQRATNVMKNVKSKEAKEGLQEAVDKATENAMKEVTKDLRMYVIVDKSGSMQSSLEAAKGYLTKILGGFPLDRLHVSVFNTVGTELNIKASKAAAVASAFQGHTAGGGTSHAEGVRALSKYKPKPEEDAVIIFVGDEGEAGHMQLTNAVTQSGINPVAFGLLKVNGENGSIVRDSARNLGIPCFLIEEKMFTADDPYAITRQFRDLIAATPVGTNRSPTVVSKRKTLVSEIMDTKLLVKPVWA
jgi:hypothetical protein